MEIQYEHKKTILLCHERVNPTSLLYGCWTLTSAMEKALDVSYTKMLRKALNINRGERLPNVTLYYGKLPKLSDKIAMRLRHCQRHPELWSTVLS